VCVCVCVCVWAMIVGEKHVNVMGMFVATAVRTVGEEGMPRAGVTLF
jgi:hypothetical protein